MCSSRPALLPPPSLNRTFKGFGRPEDLPMTYRVGVGCIGTQRNEHTNGVDYPGYPIEYPEHLPLTLYPDDLYGPEACVLSH